MANQPADRVAVTREIAAPAHEVFAVLTDPAGHVRIDGSGMLVAAPDASPVTAVGDVFRMNMDRTPLGDLPLGRYDTINTVTRIEPDELIEWNVAAPGRDPLGHVYGYELQPVSQQVTRVTSYCDWSNVPTHLRVRGNVSFPVVPPQMLERTLQRLQADVERR